MSSDTDAPSLNMRFSDNTDAAFTEEIPMEIPVRIRKISLPPSADFSQFKKICFISSAIEYSSDFSQYLSSDTYPVVYDFESDSASLKASLLAQFQSIDRVSFLFHGLPKASTSFSTTRFLNTKMFFDMAEDGVTVVPGGESQLFLQELFTAWNVKNVDFLGCSLLQSPEWKQYFALFQNVVVGASLDDTGNVRFGGNWVMENTNQNICDLYFNSSIGNYTGLLIQYTHVINSNFSLLYTIDASNNVTIVGGNATDVYALLTIPSSIGGKPVKRVQGFNNTYFTRIVIPSSVTSIGSFTLCALLTSITLSDNITIIPSHCFYDCASLVNLTLPAKLVEIGETAFGASKITNLVFPNTLTKIGPYAFWYSKILQINLPSSLRILGEGAFAPCSFATSVVIAEGLTEIPVMCFYNGTAITSISIPKSVTTIGSEAFRGSKCPKLVIPSSVTSIGFGAFAYCSSTTAIFWCGTTLPTMAVGNPSMFIGISGSIVHYCLDTVVVPNGLSTAGIVSTKLASAAFFAKMKLENVSVLNIYGGGLFTFAYLQTQYTITELYSGGITISQMYAGGITFAQMSAANSTISGAIASFVAADASSYVPTIPTSSGSTVTLSSISTLDLTDTSIIGTTTTDQKAFTASMIAALFATNTVQKQLVLPIGSVLPGFSAALTKSVYLINASAAIAYGKTTILRKATILSQNFYTLLEEGDSLTIETNSGTVFITKSGSVFTLTTNSGATTTKETGQIYSYDGLNITLGSIYGILNPTSVDFVLTALNSQIQLTTSAAIADYSQTIISDATITLNTSVSASVMQNTFFFRGDTDITSDASNVNFYVDSNHWTSKNITLSPKNGIVTEHGYVSNDAVGKDFLRDLARQLFGTYLAADLFTNEDNVISDINEKCDTVGWNIVSLINSVDITAGTFSGMMTDNSGNKYLPDNTSTTNISRELFNQLMTSAPTRFATTNPTYNFFIEEDSGYYKMPILAGDSISFRLTVAPAATQLNAVQTGRTTLANRVYTVKLNISA